MADIAGIPFVEANFDKNGNLQNGVVLPAGTTDVLIISHGWNNNKVDAQKLYDAFFGNFAELKGNFDLASRKLAIVGIFWPSKKFDDLAFKVGQSNAAAVGVSAEDEGLLAAKLDELKQTLFSSPGEVQSIDAAKETLAGIETSPAARQKFVSNIRSLLNPAAANREDASDTFFQTSEEELMENLKIPIAATVPPDVASGGAAFDIGSGPTIEEGGGAGIGSFLESFETAALNILNYTTYYEMKTRAGIVGDKGVAPLIDKLSANVERIHLIGHSFGGRLVTAAAKGSTTNKIASLTLLQAAFSHNGFSKIMEGFFRKVVDSKRVAGPIVITHSKNDTAVGIAYPIASRINNDVAMAIGDENDKFGGIGRNGAQKMGSGEVDTREIVLRDTAGKYSFSAGKFFNLKGDQFISSHGDVTNKQVVNAVLNAVAKPK